METTITLNEIKEYLEEFLITPEGENSAISHGYERFCAKFGDYICNKKNAAKFPEMLDCTSTDINNLVKNRLENQ